jgi:TolB-like protein/DNA-binding winged helix-turn-helix (wHTH) protein
LKLAKSTALRIGDWRVDPAVDEISRDGAVVKLEPLSMRLLVYLAERAGQVVGVDDLLNEIWAGVIVTSDSVYQAVAALRRTLGDNSKDPKYIATLPRRGYRLVAKVAPWSEAAVSLPPVPKTPSPPETVAMTATPPIARAPSLIRWSRTLLFVGFSLLIGYFVMEKAWHSRHLTPAAPVSAAAPTAIFDRSIAVLPFTDMSEEKDQEYFGDGMAEEIVDLLIKIPGLAVVGRTSSFQFKGKSEDLRTIGTKLNAAYVLEGGVRKSGDQIRITAQLINTRTGTHEWSETYDRHIGDVLKLQDAIAAAVVRELQLTVASRYLQSRATVKNTDAYDLMLRGRHAADRWDREGLDEAVALFQQALDRDATSAAGAALLAQVYEIQGEEGFVTPAAAFEQARRAAGTALKLDSTNLLAHYVLGRIHLVYDWDWAAADREFQQVATLAPGSAEALKGEALVSLAFGRWDDALMHFKASLAEDPLHPGTLVFLSWVQVRRGHLSEAEAALRRALDIRPTYSWCRYYLSLVLLARGDRDAALVEMQQETDDAVKQAGVAIVYYALGRKADANAALARMLKEQADVNASGIAEIYAFRGQSDEAMHWLERAYAQKDPSLYYVKAVPQLDGIAADPRFKAFLRKMNLPE